jgi:hypothetical protein
MKFRKREHEGASLVESIDSCPISQCNRFGELIRSSHAVYNSGKVAAKLIAADLAREIKARPEMAVWRRDEETEATYALKLTAAGVKAIASDEVAPPKLREESDVRKQAVATDPVTSRQSEHDVATTGPSPGVDRCASSLMNSASVEGRRG